MAGQGDRGQATFLDSGMRLNGLLRTEHTTPNSRGKPSIEVAVKKCCLTPIRFHDLQACDEPARPRSEEAAGQRFFEPGNPLEQFT
jgi:hypothetical protein